MVLEKSLQRPLDCNRIKPDHPKGNQSWISLEGLMLQVKLQYSGHLMRRAGCQKSPWCWERLREGGEGDNRGSDGWMVSLTQWTWVWVSSRSWWWTGKPGVLQSVGSQRVGHDWGTELNCIELCSEKHIDTDIDQDHSCLNIAASSKLKTGVFSTFLHN